MGNLNKDRCDSAGLHFLSDSRSASRTCGATAAACAQYKACCFSAPAQRDHPSEALWHGTPG